MKKIEKDQAQVLRKQGRSMNEIVKELQVSKSSVSIWVRDIKLSQHQRRRLSEKGRTLEAIENRRVARLANEYSRRQITFQEAVKGVSSVSERDLLLLALGLYWGEGSKTNRGSVSFCNSDPQTIQIMMRFFTDVCNVPAQKFRGHVCLHPHLDRVKAESYWSEVSGISRTQFQKTSMQHNRASKGKKDTLPFGTFTAAVYDTALYLKIMGKITGVYQKIIPSRSQVPSKFAASL